MLGWAPPLPPRFWRSSIRRAAKSTNSQTGNLTLTTVSHSADGLGLR